MPVTRDPRLVRLESPSQMAVEAKRVLFTGFVFGSVSFNMPLGLSEFMGIRIMTVIPAGQLLRVALT